MLTCQKILAQSLDLNCLTRQQKEKIEGCFEENSFCHAELKKISQDPPAQSGIGFGILGGFVLGFIVEAQLHH